MKIPNKIKKGDTIGGIAPSSPIEDKDIEQINKSIKLLEDYGFKVIFAKNAYENTLGYSATAKQRAEDINEMFADKDIKAIFCITGGFNSSSVFEYLDYDLISKNPKILCGFSDNTSITNMISQKSGIVTFNGPTLKSLTSWETDYAYNQVIKKFVQGKTHLLEDDEECYTIRPGHAIGELCGGNLSLTTKLTSGKYSIDFKDKIIFLEELAYESSPEMVCENFYNMKQNGIFNQIKGLWLGNYEGEFPIEKILLDVIGDEYDFPIIKSNNFGHIDKKMVIPIGVKAEINTEDKVKVKLLEKCVNGDGEI